MQSLSSFVCVCNGGVLPVTLSPPAEAQTSIFRAAALYLSLYPSYLIVFPIQRAEGSC